ncbi:MAG: O-antigen ligase family protein [Aggregatilineales bacterium]
MQTLDRRRIPVQLGILLTFFCIPFWYRMSYAAPARHPLYAYGFLITLPVLWTIFTWILAGFPGAKSLVRDRLRLLWVILLVALFCWMYVSVNWSFINRVRDLPEVAQSASLQFLLVVSWAIVVVCASPPPRAIVFVLIMSGVFHAIIGGLQVAEQGSLGLKFLHEFQLNPAVSGVSIIQSGDVRWLRPYGLQSHPNVFAGALLMSLMACVAGIIHPNRRIRWLSTGAFLLILWVFLLTFSRGAWLGFIAGCVALLPMLLRTPLKQTAARWGLATAIVLSILAGGGFITIYKDYLISRAQVGSSTEMRSVADRIVFTDFALRAASSSSQNTLIGIGAGNFPWRSSYYLVGTNYDLRGNNVHQIWLTVFVELGAVGFLMFSLGTMLGLEGGLRQFKRDGAVERALFIAIIVALGVIGLVDHYPVTMVQFQLAWWGLLGAAMCPVMQKSPQQNG